VYAAALAGRSGHPLIVATTALTEAARAL